MAQIFCPECGKAFDGEFALSYHRKLTHQVDDYQAGSNGLITADTEKANKRIKGAVIAGIISGVITLILALVGVGGFSPWNLVDAALTFGLTFGIYKKSRICSVILLVYWITSKVLQLSTMGTSFLWWLIVVMFTVFFFQGVLGTFSYQKVVREMKPRTISNVRINSSLENPKQSTDIEGRGNYTSSGEYGPKNQL